ncbi:MAG: helix-turn-helix domain-containing protein, partial [Roseovarius sp.]
ASVGRHWGRGGETESAGRDLVQARLALFGTDQLSPREAEVIQLVLQGHSTPGIAIQLGLAEGTVKVHRRHAYAKLGISSQAELFSMATRFVTTAPD